MDNISTKMSNFPLKSVLNFPLLPKWWAFFFLMLRWIATAPYVDNNNTPTHDPSVWALGSRSTVQRHKRTSYIDTKNVGFGLHYLFTCRFCILRLNLKNICTRYPRVVSVWMIINNLVFVASSKSTTLWK